MLLCLHACQHPGKTANSTAFLSDTEGDKALIEIEFDYKSTDCLPLDSLMDDIFYVKLETTGKNLIGQISQLLFVQDRMIVVDADISKSITVYDMSGKYLNSIGQFGPGPEDYTYIAHVTLSYDSSMVIVNDLGSKHLKYYSVDGHFIKAGNMLYPFSPFEFMTDNVIVSHNSSGNPVDKRDPSCKPCLAVINLSENSLVYSASQSFYREEFTRTSHFPVRKYGGKIFYNPSFSDTVYLVTSDGLYPRYHFTLKGIKPLTVNEHITNKIIDEYNALYPVFYGDIIELEDAVYFRYSEGMASWRSPWFRFFMYSKARSRVFCCNGVLHNPFFYFWSIPVARYRENYIVVDIRPDGIIPKKDALYHLIENLPPDKKGMLDELYRDLTEDDNPVLFFYRVNI
jgi:hypothetical protein